MTESIQNKDKVIEYLSVIRDTEVSKPAHQADQDLIEACVGLLLDLQNKNARLTPEQINEAVSKIPFVDTEKIINLKTKKKKVSKLKLLLIAAIVSVLITLLTLATMADIDWSISKKFKEMFGCVSNAPIGEMFTDNDKSFGRADMVMYPSLEEFSKDYDFDILVPGEGFTQNKLVGVYCACFPDGEKVQFVFEDNRLNYQISLNKPIDDQIINANNTTIQTINGIECYIVELQDLNQYQVYFNYKEHTYCYYYSDLEVIRDLIENSEELK